MILWHYQQNIRESKSIYIILLMDLQKCFNLMDIMKHIFL
jgi:hypothetical protein